jgi:hypothetical protein
MQKCQKKYEKIIQKIQNYYELCRFFVMNVVFSMDFRKF